MSDSLERPGDAAGAPKLVGDDEPLDLVYVREQLQFHLAAMHRLRGEIWAMLDARPPERLRWALYRAYAAQFEAMIVWEECLAAIGPKEAP